MRPSNAGQSSRSARRSPIAGIPLQSAYCAAKFAIRGFTKSCGPSSSTKKQIRVSMVQLPGINTPQFDWARAHVERHPQPVPPVFDPGVPAGAILRAAREGDAEYWLGRTVATLIVGKCDSRIDRPLSRAHRVRRTADEGAHLAGPAGQFVAPVHRITERTAASASMRKAGRLRCPRRPHGWRCSRRVRPRQSNSDICWPARPRRAAASAAALEPSAAETSRVRSQKLQ